MLMEGGLLAGLDATERATGVASHILDALAAAVLPRAAGPRLLAEAAALSFFLAGLRDIELALDLNGHRVLLDGGREAAVVAVVGDFLLGSRPYAGKAGGVGNVDNFIAAHESSCS